MCKFVVGLLTKKCKLFLGRDNLRQAVNVMDKVKKDTQTDSAQLKNYKIDRQYAF